MQITADSQSMMSPGNNTAAAGHTQTSGIEQAVALTAEMSDNMTAQVLTLEHLAHDLQQHLAGEYISIPMACFSYRVMSKNHDKNQVFAMAS